MELVQEPIADTKSEIKLENKPILIVNYIIDDQTYEEKGEELLMEISQSNAVEGVPVYLDDYDDGEWHWIRLILIYLIIFFLAESDILENEEIKNQIVNRENFTKQQIIEPQKKIDSVKVKLDEQTSKETITTQYPCHLCNKKFDKRYYAGSA